MQRYHFHLEATAGPSADADGREMLDDAAALQEAGNTAGTVLIDELADGKSKPRVTVADSNDRDQPFLDDGDQHSTMIAIRGDHRVVVWMGVIGRCGGQA